jgi:hypothetical protein
VKEEEKGQEHIPRETLSSHGKVLKTEDGG